MEAVVKGKPPIRRELLIVSCVMINRSDTQHNPVSTAIRGRSTAAEKTYSPFQHADLRRRVNGNSAERKHVPQ